MRAITVSLETLPLARTPLEQDYQQLLELLHTEQNRILTETAESKNFLQDYYAMWVHQIKVPIQAMRLLLAKEEKNSPLNLELFKIEQYVEMVLLRVEEDVYKRQPQDAGLHRDHGSHQNQERNRVHDPMNTKHHFYRKNFMAYLRQKKGFILILLLFFLICAGIFYLYHISTDCLLFAGSICFIIGSIAVGIDFSRFCQTRRKLQEAMQTITVSLETLPLALSLIHISCGMRFCRWENRS